MTPRKRVHRALDQFRYRAQRRRLVVDRVRVGKIIANWTLQLILIIFLSYILSISFSSWQPCRFYVNF